MGERPEVSCLPQSEGLTNSESTKAILPAKVDFVCQESGVHYSNLLLKAPYIKQKKESDSGQTHRIMLCLIQIHVSIVSFLLIHFHVPFHQFPSPIPIVSNEGISSDFPFFPFHQFPI